MAVQQLAGISRTDLQQHDLSVPGREVVQNRVDFVPAETVQAVKNVGSGIASELATYVVEKGKPLVVPVE